MATENTQPTEEETQQEAEAAPEEATQEAEAQPEAEPKEEAAEAKDEAKPDAEEPPPEQESAESKHKRAGGWQRKLERVERLNEMLVKKLAALEGGQPTQPATSAKKSADEVAAEFIQTQVQKQLAEIEAKRQQAAAQATFATRAQEVRAEHPDFDEVIESVSHVPVPQFLNEAILTSDQSAKIMYQLAANPAELARICALPPLAAVREVGRLEAKLASVTAAPKTPVRSATRPPAPPTNVNGSASSTRSLEDLPISEYKRAFRSGKR